MVSNPSEQQQDQEYDQNHPDKPHPGMAMAVAVPPEATRKAAQKDDDQDDDEYRSKRHATLPEGRRASPNACAVRIKAYSRPRVLRTDALRNDDYVVISSSRRSAVPSAASHRARREGCHWRSGRSCAVAPVRDRRR